MTCVAHRRDGMRCKGAPIRGATIAGARSERLAQNRNDGTVLWEEFIRRRSLRPAPCSFALQATRISRPNSRSRQLRTVLPQAVVFSSTQDFFGNGATSVASVPRRLSLRWPGTGRFPGISLQCAKRSATERNGLRHLQRRINDLAWSATE